MIAPLEGLPLAFNAASEPDVALNSRGDASVVWFAIEGPPPGDFARLKERVRPAGRSEWSLPVNIDQAAGAAQLRLDASANATAFYSFR
jgi:hypothetical protein